MAVDKSPSVVLLRPPKIKTSSPPMGAQQARLLIPGILG